jgi:phenylpropionate dioxygenase-like ring-hydroxylating dioxygenase large terminal subunit
VGLPFHQDAYGGEAGFRRKGQRLLPAPSLDTYNGLIFVSLDPDAPALRDYLGDFAFYLDYYTKQSPSGIELRGPQRWRVKANWKIGAESFADDMYPHAPDPHERRRDRPVLRAQGREAQGRLHLLGPVPGSDHWFGDSPVPGGWAW